MTQIERRDSGLAYIADESMFEEMVACRKKLKELNAIDRWEQEKINEAAKQVVPDSQDMMIIPPFYCEYGTHIHLGKGFFANYNCTLVDVGPIVIGDDCLLGPNVSIYTAGHPVHPGTRSTGWEYGKPVTIGDHCWIGGSTVILPGVTIGSGTVVGAGSVVTRDLPENVVAAGNPCRVIRPITQEDARMLYRREPIDDEAWQDICQRTNPEGE